MRTEIKLSEGYTSAVQGIMSALIRIANTEKSGFIKSKQSFSISAVTEAACMQDESGNDIVGIEVMSAPKVKGMLYDETNYFVFRIKDELLLVPNKPLIELFERQHSDKIFSDKPVAHQLIKTKENRIYGFLFDHELEEISDAKFDYEPPHSESK